MIRKIGATSAGAFLALALVACAPAYDEPTVKTTSDGQSVDITILTKTLSDGSKLECAWVRDTDSRSGFQCNWEWVNRQREMYLE